MKKEEEKQRKIEEKMLRREAKKEELKIKMREERKLKKEEKQLKKESEMFKCLKCTFSGSSYYALVIHTTQVHFEDSLLTFGLLVFSLRSGSSLGTVTTFALVVSDLLLWLMVSFLSKAWNWEVPIEISNVEIIILTSSIVPASWTLIDIVPVWKKLMTFFTASTEKSGKNCNQMIRIYFNE